jgi:N6-adenosine-specific RNA methylase IME4
LHAAKQWPDVSPSPKSGGKMPANPSRNGSTQTLADDRRRWQDRETTPVGPIVPRIRSIETYLAKLETLRAGLAEAKNVPEVKKFRDLAEAARYAAKEAGLGFAIQNDAAEIRIRAERRAGELLKQMAQTGERDQGKGGDRKSPGHHVPVKLADLGVKPEQSKRWQRIAAVPADTFEDHFQRVKQQQKELTTQGIMNLLRVGERLERIEKLTAKNQPLDKAGLPVAHVIVADPPWRHEFPVAENRTIENHYPTMSHEEICLLPVGSIAAEDAALFLWATSPKLEEAMQVLRAWGFTYRTCAVWDKQQIGMGHYFRQQQEFILVGARGALPCPAQSSRPASMIRSPRLRHSEKPAIAMEFIEQMYPEPALVKLELFARNPRPGWHAWGNQAGTA